MALISPNGRDRLLLAHAIPIYKVACQQFELWTICLMAIDYSLYRRDLADRGISARTRDHYPLLVDILSHHFWVPP